MHTETGTSSTNPYPAPRKWFSPRVGAILLVLSVIICGSVILTDHLSTRDRGNFPSTASSPRTPAQSSPEASK